MNPSNEQAGSSIAPSENEDAGAGALRNDALEFVCREFPYLLMVLFLFVMAILFSGGKVPAPGIKDSREQTQSQQQLEGMEEFDQVPEAASILGYEGLDPAGQLLLIVMGLVTSLTFLLGLGVFLWWVTDIVFPGDRDKPRVQEPWPEMRWSVWDVFKSIGLYIYLSMVCFQALRLLCLIEPVREAVSSQSSLVVATIVQLPVQIMFAVHIPYLLTREKGYSIAEIGLVFRPRLLLSGLFGWLAVLPLVYLGLLVSHLSMKALNLAPKSHPIAEELLKSGSFRSLFLMGILVSLVAPLWEELFFRGLLYPLFRSAVRPSIAMLATAAIFSTVHFNESQMISILFLGVMLAYLYETTRSIWPCVVAHSLFNTGTLLFIATMKFARSLGT